MYPEDQFPAAQWDYQLFYRENFAAARAGFEANIRATVKVLFRAGMPAGKGKPARTALIRANGGWFGWETLRLTCRVTLQYSLRKTSTVTSPRLSVMGSSAPTVGI